MNAVLDVSWRVYPAAALMLAGVMLAAAGLRLGRDGWRRPLADPAKNLTWMRGFRAGVIGLALGAVGAAWAWHIAWLFWLAVAIGGEETLESSIAIFALGRHHRLSTASAPNP